VVKRLRGFSILEVILIVVIAAAAVSPLFLIPNRDNFLRHNTRDAGQLLTEAAHRLQPAHRDAIESHLLAQTALHLQMWKSHTERRIKDLTERKYKSDPEGAEAPKAKTIQNYLRAQPRDKTEFVRAYLYLYFALNGVRTIDEVNKEKHGVAELVRSAGGSELTDPYSDPKSTRRQWNPATGEPPGLDFTEKAIERFIAGIDRRFEDVDKLYADPDPKAKTGKLGPPHKKHIKEIDEYRDAIKGVKENYRAGWLGLLAYTTNRVVDDKEKGPLVKVLQELRKDLLETSKEVGDSAAKNQSQIDALGTRSNPRDDKTADMDIEVCRLEVKVADLLIRISGEVRTVLAAQIDSHYRTAIRKAIVGEGPNNGPVVVDPRNKQQYLGRRGLIHFLQQPGYSELSEEEKRKERPPLPDTPEPAKAVDLVAPMETLFSRFPGADAERAKARGDWENSLNAILKTRKTNAELLVKRAGNPAALTLMMLADLAGRRANDRTFHQEIARIEFERLMAAVEPAREHFLELVAQWERSQKALEKDGGITSSRDRLMQTLDAGELDAKGAQLKDKDGKNRPGLRAQLDAAKKREADIRATLTALYDRAEKLDQIPRSSFADLVAQADKVRAMVDNLLKGQGTYKDRAGDFEAIIGSIKEGNRNGQIGVGLAMLKNYNEKVADVRWPYWWDYYTKYVDVKAKEAAGDEELLKERAAAKGKAPPAVDFDGDVNALIKALHARSAIDQNVEFRGVDAAKAAKIAGMAEGDRNRVLAACNAVNFAAILEKLDEAARKKVIDEADWYGVEKLISHYEGMLSWSTRKDMPQPKLPNFADRQAALGAMIYPPVPVLTARVKAAEQLLTGAAAAEGRAEVIGLDKQKTDQEAIISAARAELEPAAEAVRRAALAAAYASSAMMRGEAETANLFEEALLRWYPAAEEAARETRSGWIMVLASQNRGVTQLQAASFYLDQHRRLAGLDTLLQRLSSTAVPDGIPALWSAASDATAEKVADKVWWAGKAVGKDGAAAAIAHAGIVRNLMNASTDAKADAANFEVIGGEKKITQPVPLVRVVGWDEALASGRPAQPSLVSAGMRSLWDAYGAWRPEQKPRQFKDFIQDSTSLQREGEYFRIREEYAGLHNWPLLAAIGNGYATAYRCLADPGMRRYGNTALKEAELIGWIPQDIKPGTVNNAQLASQYFLQWAYTVNLTAVSPSLRLGGLSSLDAADPDYLKGNDDDVRHRMRAGSFILERIGFTRALSRFSGADTKR
jgi:hypothetical protein